MRPGSLNKYASGRPNSRGALGLADRDDQFNLIIAKKLVDLAQTGMRNPAALFAATVKEFKGDPE
jgi:hypothetical protein